MSAGELGYYFGSFILPMAVGYICLRIASNPRRGWVRWLGLALVVALSINPLNIGNGLAIAICVAWTIIQFTRPKRTSDIS